MKAIKVLIVEDDQFTRVTLQHSLQNLSVEVVGAFGDISSALKLAQNCQINVALLDLNLGPGANGIDLAYALRKLQPNLGIILLTSYSDPRIADPLNKNLPKGTYFLRKSQIERIDTLLSAIYITSRTPLHESRGNLPEIELNGRQISVLKLLAEGLTVAEISKQMFMSAKSIEALITKIHKQLALPKDRKLNPRVQLVLAYLALKGREGQEKALE